MTTSAVPRTAALLRGVADVRDLLEDAGRGPILILTRQGCSRVESGGDLRKALADALPPTDESPANASGEIFESAPGADLGHAPSWVDAGALCESVLAEVESNGSTAYVFCLDPWAAMLRSQPPDGLAEARWIFVSDVGARKSPPHREYWEDMEQWYGGLPFWGIVPADVWRRAIVSQGDPSRGWDALPVDARVFRQKPGAWRWVRVSPPEDPAPAATGPFLLVVRCSGSLPHLKILLESLARQQYPKGDLSVVLLRAEQAQDVTAYLDWVRIAHPELWLLSVPLLPRPDKDILGAVFDRLPGATVAVFDDHTILSESFARDAMSASGPTGVAALRTVSLNVEASAQIITGNLDPLAQFDALLQAFRSDDRLGDGGVVVRPGDWQYGISSIDALFDSFRQVAGRVSGNLAAAGTIPLLRLADLP